MGILQHEQNIPIALDTLGYIVGLCIRLHVGKLTNCPWYNRLHSRLEYQDQLVPFNHVLSAMCGFNKKTNCGVKEMLWENHKCNT